MEQRGETFAGETFSLLSATFSATSRHVAADAARVADFTRNEGVPGSSPGVGSEESPANAGLFLTSLRVP